MSNSFRRAGGRGRRELEFEEKLPSKDVIREGQVGEQRMLSRPQADVIVKRQERERVRKSSKTFMDGRDESRRWRVVARTKDGKAPRFNREKTFTTRRGKERESRRGKEDIQLLFSRPRKRIRADKRRRSAGKSSNLLLGEGRTKN